MSSAHERGLKLEKRITECFKAKGYNVEHNIKLRGRSGVEHQIDVYAEYKAPLHTSKIVVECKSYDQPIDKDIVMKLVHEVDDLGMDKGILVTTSYFTTDAVSTAQGYNIELWDNQKLKDLLGETVIKNFVSVPTNVFYVEPIIPIENALKAVDATLKGIFGRKGKIENSSTVFYPFYEMDIEGRIYETRGLISKKIEERLVNARLLVDAVTGSVCDYDGNSREAQISKVLPLFCLTEEETRVFEILSSQELTLSALASLLSCSTAKARKIVQGLVAKGVAKPIRYQQQIFYRLAIKIPNPVSLRILSNALQIKSGEPEVGVKITVGASIDAIANLVKLLWRGEITNHKVVYYPFYACAVVEGEKRYAIAVDMINSKINERISKILTSKFLDALLKPSA